MVGVCGVADGGPSPIIFEASTRTKYEVPFFKFLIVIGALLEPAETNGPPFREYL